MEVLLEALRARVLVCLLLTAKCVCHMLQTVFLLVSPAAICGQHLAMRSLSAFKFKFMVYVLILLLAINALGYKPATPLVNHEHLNVYVNADFLEMQNRMDTDDRLLFLILNKLNF